MSSKQEDTKPKVSSKKVAKKKATAVRKKTVVKKKVAGKAANKAAPSISYAEYRERIAMAAYFIAEKRLFENGLPEEDWHQAEKEVNEALAAEGLIVEPG